MDRVKLHQLMTLLNQRLDIKFTDVLRSMQTQGVNISEDDFKNRYLKRSRLTRSTVLEPDEVLAIIVSYIQTPEGTSIDNCTVFEALLMCVWSGAGLPVLKRLQHVYGKHAIERATRYYYKLDDETFDYFDDVQRKALIQAFSQQTIPSNAPSESPFSTLLPNFSPPPPLDISPEPETKAPILWEAMVITDKLLKIKNLIFNDGEFEQAMSLLNKISDEVKASDENHSDWLHYFGIIKTNQGQFMSADEALNQALALGNSWQRPRIFANLGNNARLNGDLEQARAYLERGLQEVDEPIVRIHLQTTIGTIYQDLHDLTNARFHLQQVLEQARDAKLMERQIYLLNNLAVLSLFERDYLSASETIAQALRILEITPKIQPDLVLRLRFNRARLHAIMGSYIGALEQLHQVRMEAHQFKFFHMQIYISFEIARLHLCFGQHDVALQLYQREASSLVTDISGAESRIYAIYGTVLCLIQRAYKPTVRMILDDCQYHLSQEQYTWLRQQPSLEPLLSRCMMDFQSGFGEKIETASYHLTKKIVKRLYNND